MTPVIYEHNIGAACGAWWAGDVNRCGAPNGYLVVNVTGDDISWQYKATGRPSIISFVCISRVSFRANLSIWWLMSGIMIRHGSYPTMKTVLEIGCNGGF